MIRIRLALLATCVVASCAAPSDVGPVVATEPTPEPTPRPATVPSSAEPSAGEPTGAGEVPTGAGEAPNAARDEHDLLELLAAVEAHPDPFHDVEEAAWRSDLEELRARGSLTRDEALVEVARLAVLGTGDGHGGVFLHAQPEHELWPLWLYAFEDGIRLVDGASAAGVPLGSRLVRIGDHPTADVLTAVRPLVPHDNPATVAARAPSYLTSPTVLRGLGLLPAGEVRLGWQRPDGTTVERPAPTPVPVERVREQQGIFQPQVPPSLPPDDDGPLTLRHRDEAFWYEVLEGGDVLYVGYHQVQARDPADGGSLRALVEELRARITERPPRRLVVDVRHNPGGENASSAPLLALLEEVSAAHPGTVRLLVGRSTFSAAGIFAAAVERSTEAVLVGEPTGGRPNQFGDPRRVRLEDLGVVAHVASRYHEWFPGDDRDAVEPDLAVAWPVEDLLAGHDPVLAAALAP